MEELVQFLTESDRLDSEKIESTEEETAEKVSKIMETYLGEEPDTQEALEFLCLAEGRSYPLRSTSFNSKRCDK
jgi:hypothetical protein